jgi:hypothetical protein
MANVVPDVPGTFGLFPVLTKFPLSRSLSGDADSTYATCDPGSDPVKIRRPPKALDNILSH